MIPPDCLDLYEDAEFYDQEFSARSREIPFFLEQARQQGGAVLEVACGTGRLTIPLAHAGFGVTGIDISAPMLERARMRSQREGVSVEWLLMDCRTMAFTDQFALLFSATNALLHLQTPESLSAFLEGARRALHPDGMLVLDVMNPDPAKLSRTRDTRYLHKVIPSPNGKEIRVELSSHYRRAPQLLEFDLFYLEGNLEIRRKHVRLRCLFPEELLALCGNNGLRVVHRFGDYDRTPFTDESPRQILVCKRASPRTDGKESRGLSGAERSAMPSAFPGSFASASPWDRPRT